MITVGGGKNNNMSWHTDVGIATATSCSRIDQVKVSLFFETGKLRRFWKINLAKNFRTIRTRRMRRQPTSRCHGPQRSGCSVSEWVSECVREWVSEWVSECECEYECVSVCLYNHMCIQIKNYRIHIQLHACTHVYKVQNTNKHSSNQYTCYKKKRIHKITSIEYTNTHMHAHTNTLTNFITHTHTPMPSLSLTHTNAITHTHTHHHRWRHLTP